MRGLFKSKSGEIPDSSAGQTVGPGHLHRLRSAPFEARTLALLGTAVIAFAASACTSNAGNSATKTTGSGKVTADLAYYKSKTITMIYWGSPGGVGDISSRILAPYIGRYLHATVNVSDVSGGGTIPGQNAGATATPNGLTIGMLNAAGDIGDFVQGTSGLTFSLRSIPILPSLQAASSVVVATKQSKLTSFEQMLNTKTPLKILAEANSTVGVEMQLLFGAYNIPTHFIYGYSSGAATLAGFARGDGDATMQGYSVFLPDITGGIAVPLLQTTPPVKNMAGYKIMKSVPTLEQFVKAHPPKTADGRAEIKILEDLLAIGPMWSSQVNTPAKYRAALDKAITYAASQPAAKKALIKQGDNIGIVKPSVLKSDILNVLASQSKLKVWLEKNAPPKS